MTHPDYNLVFCEADTGTLLNQDGSRWNKDKNLDKFNPSFNSLQEALTVKDKLLFHTPNGEVVIEHNGKTKTYRDEERITKFMKEREAIFAWRSLPPWFRIFKSKPICTEYPKHDNNY